MTNVITVRVTKCNRCGCPFSAMSEDAVKDALADHYMYCHHAILLTRA